MFIEIKNLVYSFESDIAFLDDFTNFVDDLN